MLSELETVSIPHTEKGDSRMSGKPKITRRKWLASALMGTGLLISYGVLAVQGLLYILPPQVKSRTRKLYAGHFSHYDEGKVREVYDLDGNLVLVKRGKEGLRAFNTVCPHLGCRVHWEEANDRFFCPCHRGVFDGDGVAIAGPPADAGQRLAEIPVTVDEKGGAVYLEVKEARKA